MGRFTDRIHVGSTEFHILDLLPIHLHATRQILQPIKKLNFAVHLKNQRGSGKLLLITIIRHNYNLLKSNIFYLLGFQQLNRAGLLRLSKKLLVTFSQQMKRTQQTLDRSKLDLWETLLLNLQKRRRIRGCRWQHFLLEEPCKN